MTTKNIPIFLSENTELTSNLLITALSGDGNTSVTAFTILTQLEKNLEKETISLIIDKKNEDYNIIHTGIIYNSEESLSLSIDDFGTTVVLANTTVVPKLEDVNVDNLILRSGE